MTIDEFCRRHNACSEGRTWAAVHCRTMREVWDTARHTWLIWIALTKGVLPDQDVRRFAAICAADVRPLLQKEDRLLDAIDMAEKLSNSGNADEWVAEVFDSANLRRKTMMRELPISKTKVPAATAVCEALICCVMTDTRLRDCASDVSGYSLIALGKHRGYRMFTEAWDKEVCPTVLDRRVRWLRENTKPNFKCTTTT